MNNKGFAITTLIYGLAIMGILLITTIMATLSSTRRSVVEMVNETEKELLGKSEQNILIDSSKTANPNGIYEYQPKETGYYRIELWGYGTDGYNGNYIMGIFELSKDTKYYIKNDNTMTDYSYSYISTVERPDCTLSNTTALMCMGTRTYNTRPYSIHSSAIYWKIVNGAGVGDGKARITKINSRSNIDQIKNKVLPEHGKYYIIAKNGEKALTATTTTTTIGEPVTLQSLSGDDNQIWTIDLLSINKTNSYKMYDAITNTTNKKEYRLIENSFYRALDIKLDENKEFSFISSQYTFNTLSMNQPQIWNIEANTDGTFSIRTTVKSKTSIETGYITKDEYDPPKFSGPNPYVYIGKINSPPSIDQKFILIPLE